MNNKQWDALWINAAIATMRPSLGPYGMLSPGAIAIKNGKIAWLGTMSELSSAPDTLATVVHDVKGRCITPGLIDCHTHLVYAGNRYTEFEMRMQGKSYTEIAQAGGGIRSTVKATRDVSEDELFDLSLMRAKALCDQGVTVVEIKSGYGLNLETELKMLRVARRIGQVLPLTVKTTFLGAHALPEDYRDRADEYITLVCEEVLPAGHAEGLIDAVDVFCETIGFSLAQTERVFQAAKKYHLPIKCHSEQLSDSESGLLAAQYHALSVDHVEFISEKSIKALAQSGTVAVLLPGAFYYLREQTKPPVALFRQYGVPMAIATDCNPGTSPTTSLVLMLNMACVVFGMTPEEALLGVTRHAAKALGLSDTHGTLEVGKSAEFVIWDAKHPAELAYYMGGVACVEVVRA